MLCLSANHNYVSISLHPFFSRRLISHLIRRIHTARTSGRRLRRQVLSRRAYRCAHCQRRIIFRTRQLYPAYGRTRRSIKRRNRCVTRVAHSVTCTIRSRQTSRLIPTILINLCNLYSLAYLFLPRPFPHESNKDQRFLFLFFPLFKFQFHLFLHFNFPSFRVLRMNFLLSKDSGRQRIFVPFRPFPFLLNNFFPPQRVSVIYFPPIRGVRYCGQCLLLRLSINYNGDHIFFTQCTYHLFTRTIRRITITTRRTLTSALLYERQLHFLLPRVINGN